MILPPGLRMALRRDPAAMAAFTALPPPERRAVAEAPPRQPTAARLRDHAAEQLGERL